MVGQKYNATVAEICMSGLSVAGVSQQLRAPKTWIGSDGVNLFQVVCDMLDLFQQMNMQLAAHTHLPGPALTSNDVAAFIAKGEKAAVLMTKF